MASSPDSGVDLLPLRHPVSGTTGTPTTPVTSGIGDQAVHGHGSREMTLLALPNTIIAAIIELVGVAVTPRGPEGGAVPYTVTRHLSLPYTDPDDCHTPRDWILLLQLPAVCRHFRDVCRGVVRFDWLQFYDPDQDCCDTLTAAIVSRCVRNFNAVRGISVAWQEGPALGLLEMVPRTLGALNLSFCSSVNDSTLGVIATTWPNLEIVHLEGCSSVGDAGVMALCAGCPGIVELTLDDTDVTDVGVAAIAARCPKLHSLRLANSTRVTDAALHALGDGAASLKLLALRYMSAITDVGVVRIAERCHQLQSLDLEGSEQIGHRSAMAVVQHCRHIQLLNLFGCHRVPPSALGNVRTALKNTTLIEPTSQQDAERTVFAAM